MTQAAFMYAETFEQWEYPPDCPFRASRVGDTYRLLRDAGLLEGADRRVVAPEPAAREALLAIHDTGYLDVLERAAGGDLGVDGLEAGLGTPDTPVFADVFFIGLAAAGAAIEAADLLLRGECTRTFSPLGGFHHARRHQAGGFCYVNDVALACEHLARAGRRVLSLDLDAHHGDGTQDAFYDRSNVMTISLHQSGKTLFPWAGFENETGSGDGEGYNVNLCFPEETYDEIYLQAFHEVVPTLIEAYAPDVVIVELGMDILAGDPLTRMALTNNTPTEVLAWLCSLDLPLLVTGGGGYHVKNTVRGWARAWETLCDEDDDHVIGLGGDFLGGSDWRGAWKDPVRQVSPEQRARVDAEVEASIARVKREVFPRHGLGESGPLITGAPI